MRIKNVWIRNENEFTELTIPEYVTKFSGVLDHASHIQKICWNAVHCINANADDYPYGIFYGTFYYYCELVLGDKVEYVDRNTFWGNDRLNKISVGSGLKEVGESAFGNIYGNSRITFNIKDLKQWIEIKGIDKAIIEYVGNDLYLNGELVTELTIPDGKTEIPAKIFQYGSYRKIVIPEGVTKIGDKAFSGCNKVQELILPDTLTDIGEHAFSGLKITELDIPDSVVSIGDYAFTSSILTRVVLGTGLKDGTVGANVFDGCNIFEVYDKCYFGFGTDANLCGKVAKNAYRIIRPNDYNQESSVHKVQGEDGNTYVYYERYNQSEMATERIFRGYIGTNNNPILPDNITHIRYNFGNIEYVVIPESVRVIENGSFYVGNNLEHVFYAGDESGYDAITVGWTDNGGLTKSKVYYYSETAPAEEGNFWHYVNGVPTPWDK
ncbi:MAG: leucine-rich repeat protein [Clostridia bacterium]|nr:leucine-rich repeat protein [Clostridia bacterium]